MKNKEYYSQDVLGSVIMLTDSRGNTKETYSYDVFGNQYGDNSFGSSYGNGWTTGVVNEYGYNGKRFDSAVGLADYGFRDCTPQVGRFPTVDPIKSGLNWYAYVGNDPVDFIDPLGLTASDSQSTTFSFGQIDNPQDAWIMQNEAWSKINLGGGYTFGGAGCKACSGSMITSAMTGNNRATPLDLQTRGYIDANGNLNRGDIESAIEAYDSQKRDIIPDYWEKQLDKDKILEIANENTYVLGRASLGSIVDEHWVVLEGGRVTDDGDVIFDYTGSSKNDNKDPARTYTLNTFDEAKRIYKIYKIETFTFTNQ